jgi:Pvc16 N-terminal domain
MPVTDLSLVTTTFLRLLKARVDPLWASLFPVSPPNPPPPSINYTGVGSSNLSGDNALSFFLYHINEDAYFKNQPPFFKDQPPVRFTPMGLLLNYQLVAQTIDGGGDPNSAVLRAQRLFGLALKTLHDYASIDRTTQIAGSLIFPPAIQNTENLFRVTLKNITANEVSNFWTAGNQPIRLAAYYEVSTAMLEPDQPQLRVQRVLRYGVQVFVNGAPRLDASRSTVTFRIPGESSDRTAEVQPGEAAQGENLTFDGTDLIGDSTTLLIRKTSWNEPQEVGVDWGVTAGPTTVSVAVGNSAGTQTVVPGVYSAAARVTRKKLMPDGTLRAFSQESNQVPFTVAPTITNPAYNTVAAALGPQNIVTIDGGIFQHPEVAPINVRVFVGPTPVLLEPTLTLTPGHFEIVGPTQLQFRFPLTGVSSGAILPLRVIVNGAENSPRWVSVP